LASIALAQGENTRAQELLTRYLTSLDRLPGSGMIAAERRRVRDMKIDVHAARRRAPINLRIGG
jgi:hypothetical protein